MSTTPHRRPSDFPHDAVSVSKIRAKLERDGLLSTGIAMPSNHRDVTALSSILNTSEPRDTHAAVHTNSLETRLKFKDTNPNEWHSRRKSYGFEKMSTPDKTNLRVDTSTDSGLGRSADLANWFPASESSPLIRLSDAGLINTIATVSERPEIEKYYEQTDNLFGGDEEDHTRTISGSRHQTIQAHFNGPQYYQKSETKATSVFLQKGASSKRVEFSKTEVHFATGTGRVNIIETDSKPPSTNNFRKKKTITTTQSLVKSATAIGQYIPWNEFQEQSSKRKSSCTKANFLEEPIYKHQAICDDGATNVTVTVPIAAKRNLKCSENNRNSYASTSGADTTDYDTDEIASLKGILKTKPIREKRYILADGVGRSSELRIGPLQSLQNNQDLSSKENLQSNSLNLNGDLKSTSLILKTMHSANEFDEAMRRLSIASIHSSLSYPNEEHDLDISVSLSSTLSEDSEVYAARNNSTPRLSFLGNSQIPLKQQLQRLNLMYDAAISNQNENNEDTDDRADEEVKKYFRENTSDVGTQNRNSFRENNLYDYSHSWNRRTAKKAMSNLDNIGSQNHSKQYGLPKSTVMSVKLNSPQLRRTPTSASVIPVAKPRNVETKFMHSSANTKFTSSLPTQDSLKIIKETRGARQLRDHELSYFGIKRNESRDDDPKTNTHFTSNVSKRSLPVRVTRQDSNVSHKLLHSERNKPDLLRHCSTVEEEEEEPIARIDVRPAERKSLKLKTKLADDEEHLYENIANDITTAFKVKIIPASNSYDRKGDFQRDLQILNEMNENADETLQELSGESSVKGRHRKSSQRRNSKPLETINEKISKLSNDSIVVNISRGTFASEARRSSRQSTPSPEPLRRNNRTPSESSIEECPRARSRSRSLSSEKDYENIKYKVTHPLADKQKHMKQLQSSSCYSPQASGDISYRSGSIRRENLSRIDSKQVSNSRTISAHDKYCILQDKPKTVKQLQNRSRYSPHASGDEGRYSSTGHRADQSHINKKQFPNSKTTETHDNSYSRRRSNDKNNISTSHSLVNKECAECKSEKRNSYRSLNRQQQHTATSSLSKSRPHIAVEDDKEYLIASRTGSANKMIDTKKTKHNDHNERISDSQIQSSQSAERNIRSSASKCYGGAKDKERIPKSKGHSNRSKSHHHIEAASLERQKTETDPACQIPYTTATGDNVACISVTCNSLYQRDEQNNLNKYTATTSNEVKSDQSFEEPRVSKFSDENTLEDEQKLQEIPPAKPPRRKRKQSLIPIAVPIDEHEKLIVSSPNTPRKQSFIYECKVKTNIAPTYSNQSTLRKSSLPRPVERPKASNKSRKSSLKYAQSTSSSFAFIPYLAAKRNSNFSNIYDNCMLYAVPASINTKAYKQPLINDHKKFSGGSGNRFSKNAYKKIVPRRRTVRSSVSTHHPFGICACS